MVVPSRSNERLKKGKVTLAPIGLTGVPFRLTRALLRLNNASLTHLSLKHEVEVIKWTILLSCPLSSTFSIAVVFSVCCYG